MPTIRLIKPQYPHILRTLAGNYVPNKEKRAECVIRKSATMLECTDYALYYIVGRQRPYAHYRYNRYYYFVIEVMKHYKTGTSVFHLDLGCGPELFTWVIRDYFRKCASVGIDSHGYDHAPNMVELARKVWERLGVTEKYRCSHSVNEIISASEQASMAYDCVVVTFGHVLIQTRDNKTARDTFARIIATVAESAKCIIIASDAHSGDQDARFKAACRDLKTAIARRGFAIDMHSRAGESGMYGEIRAKMQA